MRAFACPNCAQPIQFEARVCPACGATLGYDPAVDDFRFLADQATVWRDSAGHAADEVVCANNDDHAICNWLTPPGLDGGPVLCLACRHNHVIPDLTQDGVAARWASIEAAKRRLIHTLLRLGLPLETQEEAGDAAQGADIQGLAFEFLYDPSAEGDGPPTVFTGHDSGTITLNLIEADDARREAMRLQLGEAYRTLLGHFRHEVGHHYWSRLVEPDPAHLARFREVFGDERADYAHALQRHYASTDDGSWRATHISFYAASHPWEDFAESFAHYLHIVDALDTAAAFHLKLRPPAQGAEVAIDTSPYRTPVAELIPDMQALSFMMNAMSRGLGHHDIYPFAMSEGAIAKLAYIGDLVEQSRLAFTLT